MGQRRMAVLNCPVQNLFVYAGLKEQHGQSGLVHAREVGDALGCKREVPQPVVCQAWDSLTLHTRHT